MSYSVIDTGGSRSFPEPYRLLDRAQADGDVVVLVGTGAGAAFRETWQGRTEKLAILVELGTECLGVHTGERRGEEGSNALGFARFRLGDAEPTNLVELVRQPRTPAASIAAARAVFEGAGLKVAVCRDFPGRIVDRLIRPVYNAALRRLDEGLATAEHMDMTMRLGLGYPEGPIERLERTGLVHHFDVTQALWEQLGDPAYAPARRARVAKERAK
jgi:3-hydroxybutyryl-CoA dehydrogenase